MGKYQWSKPEVKSYISKLISELKNREKELIKEGLLDQNGLHINADFFKKLAERSKDQEHLSFIRFLLWPKKRRSNLSKTLFPGDTPFDLMLDIIKNKAQFNILKTYKQKAAYEKFKLLERKYLDDLLAESYDINYICQRFYDRFGKKIDDKRLIDYVKEKPDYKENTKFKDEEKLFLIKILSKPELNCYFNKEYQQKLIELYEKNFGKSFIEKNKICNFLDYIAKHISETAGSTLEEILTNAFGREVIPNGYLPVKNPNKIGEDNFKNNWKRDEQEMLTEFVVSGYSAKVISNLFGSYHKCLLKNIQNAFAKDDFLSIYSANIQPIKRNQADIESMILKSDEWREDGGNLINYMNSLKMLEGKIRQKVKGLPNTKEYLKWLNKGEFTQDQLEDHLNLIENSSIQEAITDLSKYLQDYNKLISGKILFKKGLSLKEKIKNIIEIYSNRTNDLFKEPLIKLCDVYRDVSLNFVKLKYSSTNPSDLTKDLEGWDFDLKKLRGLKLSMEITGADFGPYIVSIINKIKEDPRIVKDLKRKISDQFNQAGHRFLEKYKITKEAYTAAVNLRYLIGGWEALNKIGISKFSHGQEDDEKIIHLFKSYEEYTPDSKEIRDIVTPVIWSHTHLNDKELQEMLGNSQIPLEDIKLVAVYMPDERGIIKNSIHDLRRQFSKSTTLSEILRKKTEDYEPSQKKPLLNYLSKFFSKEEITEFIEFKKFSEFSGALYLDDAQFCTCKKWLNKEFIFNSSFLKLIDWSDENKKNMPYNSKFYLEERIIQAHNKINKKNLNLEEFRREYARNIILYDSFNALRLRE